MAIITQDKLNVEMRDLGKQRYWKGVTEARMEGAQTTTRFGQTLLSASIEPLANQLKVWLEANESKGAGRKASAYRYLKELSPELLALYASRCIIDSLGDSRPLARVVFAIGQEIEDEVRFNSIKENHPGLWRKLNNQLDRCTSRGHKRTVVVLAANRVGIQWVAWPESIRLNIGAVLVDLFCKTTGLAEIYPVREGRKTRNMLAATEKAVEWIREYHEHAEMLSPVWLPTVEQPIAWTSPYFGGYKADDLIPVSLVKRTNKAHLERLAAAQMPDVYATVNALQSTAWQINKPVLDVMHALWEANVSVSGLPQRNPIPLPPPIAGMDDDPVKLKEWKRAASEIYAINASNNSLGVAAARLLFLGDKYHKLGRFYFPYQLDFRGRIYTVPAYLSPQGDDQSRGILTFADGCTMADEADAEWLKIYGANLYGVDKVSFDERKAWVDAHRDDILRSADDPLGTNFWRETDDAWKFLAWCFEWAGWLRTGPGYVTHLPVCVDGTNNGLQLLSLLVRDEVAAAATNVSPSSSPQDIYRDVAEGAKALMRLDTESPYAPYWLEFDIDRKTTKRPVMVLPYGGTFQSCRDYISEWYKKTATKRGLSISDKVEFGKRTHYLAMKVWEAIDSCVTRPRLAMLWLQQIAGLYHTANLPVRWTTPVGLVVEQAYKTTTAHQVETALGDRILYISKDVPTDLLDRRRQKNGISPNFVHSLDGSALMRTVSFCASAANMKSFCMIHDSYGTHSPKMHEMAAILRHTFADMFTPDLLSKFREEAIAALPAGTEIPPVPEFGTLNPASVRESEFFFA